MESNTNPKAGFWMQTEELQSDFFTESPAVEPEKKTEYLDDGFFPDTSF